MTAAEILEDLCEHFPDLLLADGVEDALMGIVDGASRQPVAAYDYAKCLKILIEGDGMSEDEAEEYMSFNVTDAYVGDLTPMFVHDWRAI
jgi:hypothetical protein